MSSIQSGVARHQSPGRVPHGWVGGAGQGRVWFGSAQVTGGAGWPPTLHTASLQCNPACLITNCTLWLPSSPNSAVECWAAEVCAPQVWRLELELVQVVMKRNGLLNLSPVPAKTSDIATKARHSYSVSRQIPTPPTAAPHGPWSLSLFRLRQQISGFLIGFRPASSSMIAIDGLSK